ncbi:hypothetical protein, partial [Paraburkholderia sp. J63]|uniref:hypothetical protein n=1 Tax=Paraburkholderia sp. J63 TaxID=2805434 RepID=UPI002ABDB733
ASVASRMAFLTSSFLTCAMGSVWFVAGGGGNAEAHPPCKEESTPMNPVIDTAEKMIVNHY